jgi:hypothetical protein
LYGPIGSAPTGALRRVRFDRQGSTCSDLLQVLGSWGSCPACPADIDGDDLVDVSELIPDSGEGISRSIAGDDHRRPIQVLAPRSLTGIGTSRPRG